MDDLLRRASEAYPLREGKDRWQEIESKITIPTGVIDNDLPKQKRTYKALPVLFTLLFLALSLFISERSMVKKALPVPVTDKFSNERNSGQVLLQEENLSGKVNSNYARTMKQTAPGVNDYSKTNEKIQDLQNERRSIEANNGLSHGKETRDLNLVTHTIQCRSLETNYVQLKTFPGEPINEMKLKKIIEEPTSPSREKTAGKRIYFGGTLAMSFSTVKNSGLSKSGYSLGLLAGYRFTRSTSLELGLSYSKKYYSSKGDYFDMNEMGSAMSPGMQIMEVDGSNHVIEIPLHLKYDFYPGRRSEFYSTIGFSSYLMTQEQNQYDLMTNGVAQKMTGTYKNDRQYIAATLDLSIGYEKNLGPISMRLEPYVQIPLKGVGIGKLPVTSFGGRLGIIH